MGGGTGTAQAQIYATNTSATPCTLSGFPVAIELLRGDGSVLPTVTLPPSALPEPPMPLAPGVPDAASLGLNWQNWCGGDPGPLRIRITLPGGAGIVTGDLNGPPGGSFLPRCDQPAQTSALEVLWSFGPTP